jgi:hypothetical protein
MSTISHAQIRKALYGLMLLGVFVFLIGASNLPAAHAQAAWTPTPTSAITGSVGYAIPNSFEKKSPDSGTTIQGTTVTLEWYSTTVITGYYHCVDKTDNNVCDNNVWIYNDDTNRTLTNLEPGSTYYWQVMACNHDACIGADDGDWWSFTIAPVIFNSTGSQDGWILESSETSGVGGTKDNTAATFRLGDDSSNRQYRAILSFDTSSLPNDAVIKSAVLKIKQSGSAVGSNPFSILDSLYADIRKGYFGSSSSLQLADFNAAATASKVGAFGTTPVSGWYSATLNSTGRSNINKTSLTQFRLFFNLDDNDNNVADYMKFVSGDASSNKPQLIIKYTLP